jgi:hypothetical protein
VPSGDCLDPSELDRLARGDASADEWARHEAHLDGCRPCAQTLAELARIYGSVLPPSRANPKAAGRGGPPKTAIHVSPSTPPPAFAGTPRTPWTPSSPPPTLLGQGTAHAPTYPSNAPPPFASAPPPPNAQGATLGRYQLGARLGEGGMGVVFDAWDPELDRRVAVKLLHPDPHGDPERHRARLIREAKAMAKLSHPNVVAIYDVGRVGEQLFVACELVDGETLGAWLRRARRAPREVIDRFVLAGRGLEAAHAVGLVHRDFKPENVLVGRDGRPRVTDFGLARAVDEATQLGATPYASASGPVATAHTAAGAFAGTPAYMAPEQWRGEPADARTDQFSFCVALYEALFGRAPFAGDTIPERMRTVLEGRVLPPPGDAPAWLRAAVLRGLAPRREDRWPSMGALLGELSRERGGPRRALLAALGVLGGAGALATVIFLFAIRPQLGAAQKPAAAPAVSDSSSARAEEDSYPDCALAGLDGRWNDARRSAVADAAARADVKLGAALGKRANAQLDAWAKRIRAARAGACKAAVTPESPRASCVDDRRRAFDALVSTLEKGSTYAFENAPGAIDEALDAAPPEACGDDGWLRTNAPPSPAKEARARIALVRDDVAKVRAGVALGAIDPVRELATQALVDATKLGDASLLGEARYAAGLVARARGEPVEAEPLLTDALASAKEAKRDALAAEIALALTEVVGVELASPTEAERWLEAGRELLRAGDEAGEVRVAITEGRLRLASWELVKAKEVLTKGLGTANRLDEQGAASGALRVLLARTYLAAADPEHAASRAAQAQELFEARGGDHDQRLADALIARGEARSMAGAHDDAIAFLLRARKLREGESIRFADDRLFFVEGALARAYAAAGRSADATKEEKHAHANMEFHAAVDGRRVWMGVLAGDLRRAEGKPKEAVTVLAAGLAIAEKEWGIDDPRLVEPLRALAVAQAEAGDDATSRKSFERALALADAAFGVVSPMHGLVAMEMGEASERAKLQKRALDDYDEAFLGLHGGLGEGHPRVDANVVRRGRLCLALGDRKRALELLGAALSNRERLLGADDPSVAALRAEIAAVKP